MTEENAAANAICSICYEDLKPVAENLQSISACGHVFHELCLQQWFEYCPATNKRNCPICKQKCSLKDPFRLYFQSSENQIDSKKSDDKIEEEDPVLLRNEVNRLEGKIHNLTLALENQKKVNVDISDKLNQCKEQIKEDKVKKWEAMQEILAAQNLLKAKSEECVQLNFRCGELHERTMALAKELASLKLVSDISLDEDDVRKLALLGNNANTKDTIDTLVKSLVSRNKSYKELLAKCNQLGRGEALSSERLEKALEKIDKLKKQVREFELITEERENKALRDLKFSKNYSGREVSQPGNESVASFRMFPSDNTVEKISTPPLGRFDIRHSDSNTKDQKGEDTNVQEKHCNPMMKDMKFNISNNDPISSVSPRINGAGGISFLSGLNQNLGRWNKQGDRNLATPTLGGSVSGKDDLIAFGPDGKGGRIKILRSNPQLSNVNASSGSGKRVKFGTKTNGSSSQENRLGYITKNANANSETRFLELLSMVSVNPRPTQGFPFLDPVNMSFNSPTPNSDGFRLTPIAPVTTVSFSEDSTMKIRKPYTIKKSRENWTEQEHDKFLEALHLFDRDWKKIEAFVGSKTVVQIRSHAQKYFLKVQKSGTNEHLPPPRPKRKASHPYPQKAPKNVALTSHVVGSLPASNVPSLIEPGYLYNADSQSLLGNPAVCVSSSSSWSHESANPPIPLIEEEPGVSATALPKNLCYSTSSKEDTRRLLGVTKPKDEDSCDKPPRVMPNFAEVYSFIGSVFDPNTTGHLQRLKEMDPINMETVLLLMRNLSLNLTSPEFAEQRKLISSYSAKTLK
ncbi:hypothetical protein AALP_AA6G017500 [Arabis alpina]|uniref:Uncharacterized protein n=1 Tax=Arabis alpina TaxID=50452 RepID=A0A087GLF7_ARAAL|nr:hypothetical protein AALP_AA6G017500 [Arabis alpina]